MRFVIRPHVNTAVRCIAFVYATLLCAHQENILVGGMKCDARSTSWIQTIRIIVMPNEISPVSFYYLHGITFQRNHRAIWSRYRWSVQE